MNKPDWQITATTVHCDAVNDEVTLLVYADGTAKCTGSQKHAASGKKGRPASKKSRECREADCTTLIRYRDSLLKTGA